MKTLYYDEKHWFWFRKHKRIVHLDHPEGEKSVIHLSANLDNEQEMERLKLTYNRQVDLHNLTGVDHSI